MNIKNMYKYKCRFIKIQKFKFLKPQEGKETTIVIKRKLETIKIFITSLFVLIKNDNFVQ